MRTNDAPPIQRDRLARGAPKGYSGHSLRAGLATGAIKAGAPLNKVWDQTSHASDLMLLRYLSDGGALGDKASDALL